MSVGGRKRPKKTGTRKRAARSADPEHSITQSYAQHTLEQIYMLLRAQTGHDFFYYKRQTIERRVERRMGVLQLQSAERYADYLAQNPFEIELLLKELLIGVTSFFRDPEAWNTLKRNVLQRMIANHSGSEPLRAWVAGCSTGEEAYSLAMAFREAADELPNAPHLQVRIFATDLDREAIDKARMGLYPGTIAAELTASRLARFFVQEGRNYRVRAELRELIVFWPHNMVMDPPITKLDLLCCRNFLIYLSAGLQEKLLSVFHYCLKPEATLFLGVAESALNTTKLYRALDSQSRIYQRTDQAEGMRGVGV